MKNKNTDLALIVGVVGLVLIILALMCCTQTDAYLPAETESANMVVEKVRGVLYAWTHPLSQEAQDRGKVFQGASLLTTGH